MRTLRSSVRNRFGTVRVGVIAATLAGVALGATDAQADTAGLTPTSKSATGTAALKFDYIGSLDTSIDSGWMGPDLVQARILIKLDPVKNGGPLYSVQMPKGALIQASWSGDKKIVLKATSGIQNDGVIRVRHTLTPSFEMKVHVDNLTATFNFDSNKLLNKTPGSSFAYDSRATQAFMPWGFTPVAAVLSAPDLNASTLFSSELTDYPDIVNVDDWAGTFGIRATTTPTFNYQTKKIVLTGASKPLTTAADEAVVDAIDGDFMEVMAQVEGVMNVAGSIDIVPFVQLTKAFGSPFEPLITFDGYSKQYTSPASPVAFQSALVHIPLPNVHVPDGGINLGDIKSGGSATKSVVIQNTGEKAATFTVKSSDPQFTVTTSTITIAPKGKYNLKVKFSSSSDQPALADITIESNDPDAPEQSFQIGANGADVKNGDGTDAKLPGGAPSAGGCGCKTVASPSPSSGGLAGLALALGLAAFVRRRRSIAQGQKRS